MSSVAYARPLSAPQPARQRPHIEIVATRAQRRARPKAVYAVVTIASLFVIFAAQLLLSIAVSEGAYEISTLQGQQKELVRTQEALDEELQVLDSTQNLSAQAAGLGMVPNGHPRAIDLASGDVYRLPGTAEPSGCGGACGLVANALLDGIPLVTATAVVGQPVAEANPATAPTGQAPMESASLPAPVTH